MSGRRTPAARSPTPRSSDVACASMNGPPARAGLLRAQPMLCSAGKALDQPAVELREEAGEEGDAGEHEQRAHHPLDVGEMGAKAREEGRERLDRERGDDERHAEARANRPRAGPRPWRPWPWRPRPPGLPPGSARCTASSRARRQAPSHRRPKARRASASSMRACRYEQADRREPEKVQAHDDDGDAGDDRELVRVKAHQRADRAGAGAERDEDGREAAPRTGPRR